MADKDKLDDLQSDDLDEKIGIIARAGTDANVFIQILVAIAGTAATHMLAVLVKNMGDIGNFMYGVITDRGPIQYIELFMAFMVVAQILLKQRIVKQQMKIIYQNPVDPSIDFNDEGQIQKLRKRIINHPKYAQSIVLSRMERILHIWTYNKDVGRVTEWAAAESERDTSSSDQSYALSRVLIWAIPILGFIGTVFGLGSAVGGFSAFLSSEAELSQIKGAIREVTLGLGVAFDTTLLALILVTCLMFPLTLLQRREESLFVEIDIYLDDVLISHFPSPEQQPIVIENLEDAIEAAFRRYIPDPDRYEEVFTFAIDRAAQSVEERFTTLSSNYEAALRDMTERLSGSFSAVGDSMELSVRKVADDIRSQEEGLIEVRRKVADNEREQLQAMLEKLHSSAQGLAETYRDSAQSLQQATTESAKKSIDAAGSLAEKMAEVTRLAAGIEDLLKVEQSIEKGLEGISSSEEFQKTLEELRAHLATTDSFCSSLSKPRVITLHEEIIES